MVLIAVLREVDSLPVQYPQVCLVRLSQLAEDVMGGTSGALYSLMLVAASRTAPDWPTAWQQALQLAMTYSKARVGSRTMVSTIILMSLFISQSQLKFVCLFLSVLKIGH